MFFKNFFSKKSSKSSAPDVINTQSINAVVLTDMGNIRKNNEDTGLFYRIADKELCREKGYLLIVADGMGGHNAGEVASQMAAEIISTEYYKNNSNQSIEKKLHSAFISANKKIFEHASSNSSLNGMGTTCTALVIRNQQVFYAHAGDSRAYFLHQQAIHRITKDHTYVQELVNKGDITEEEADTHPKRNILTNAMGTKPELLVDKGKCAEDLETGDRLMLCSDGVYEYLKDKEIQSLLSEFSIYDAAEKMIQLGKQRGGHDNLTIVLVEKTAKDEEKEAKETRDVTIPLTQEHDIP